MKIAIPELCLVALVGASGSGKSTFAARHFRDSEVVSSDACRKMVSDDENDQSATPAAFDVLRTIAAKRLAAGRIAVVDATSVQREDRRMLVELAKQHHVFAVEWFGSPVRNGRPLVGEHLAGVEIHIVLVAVEPPVDGAFAMALLASGQSGSR